MVRLLLFSVVAATAVLTVAGCAAPRWVSISDDRPHRAINNRHLRQAVVVAVHEALAYQAGTGVYDLVLPRSANPETYAVVVHGLAPDARVPAGIPEVLVDPATGRVARRAVEVRRAEALSLPVAAPDGQRPIFEVHSLRLDGQTGEVDIVRPLSGGRRVLTVGLDLDPGHGWRATGARVWRALDPDSGL